MITLRISFLLAIDLGKDLTISKKPRPGVEPKLSKIPEDGAYSILKVPNPPLRYVHVDYELLGKKFTVDVVCWGPVAKIFTKGGAKCLKTITTGNVVWVPVFIEHYLNPLSNEELRKFLGQIVRLRIKMGKGAVGAKAKSEKSSIFYQFEEDARNDFFPELYTERPKDDDYIRKEIGRILNRAQYIPTGHEILTWIYNTDDVHAYRMAKIITKRCLGEELHYKDFYQEEKSKKGRKSEKQKLDFRIPAHVFFSDPGLATYQVKDSELAETYILLSSEEVLTKSQTKELCPLVVKIRKINNLPCDILTQNGFSQLFLTCTVPGLAEFRTSMRPVTSRVVFDESRFIITSDFPKIKVLELLETQKVVVKIIGVRESPQKSDLPQSEKRKKKKKHRSKSKDGTTKPPVITEPLAVALFDLSPLSKTFFLFKEKGQCVNLRTEKQRPLDDYFIDRFTMNEMNLVLLEINENHSPLKTSTMVLEGTTVKFEAHFLRPTHPLFYLNDGSTYRRLLVILFKQDAATLLLSSVMGYNRQFLGSGPLVVPNFLIQKYRMTDKEIPDDRNKMISGFMIDDGDCYIIFIEGPSNGYILTLVHQVSEYNYSTGKVFYNSEYLFEERLYMTFHKFSGLYTVHLKVPLAEILAQVRVYVVGNVPVPCLKAIQKLDLILKSTTFKSILDHDYMPTEIELLTLGMEFGVPMKCKTQDLTEAESEWEIAGESFESHLVPKL